MNSEISGRGLSPTSGDVSAILATYNRARYIDETLESLLAQSVPLREIIVVDDGSTDDTAERVARYGHRIRYLRKENGGKSSALNLAIPHASGDWLWFFDDDDVALEDSVERRLAASAIDPAADVIISGQYIGSEDAQGRIVARSRVDVPFAADAGLLLNVLKSFSFRLQGMLVRRTCFDQVGFFDERYLRSQDYEMIVRLVRNFPSAVVPAPTFVWRNHFGTRGPEAERHSGRDRDRVWMEFDGMLGRQIRSTFRLGEYLIPRLDTDSLTPSLRRAALLNRMSVMASKGLVDETFEDLYAACNLEGATGSLTADEREACVAAALHPYFAAKALRSPATLLARFRRAGRNPLLKEAAGFFARAFLFAARASAVRSRDANSYLGTALRLAALAGFHGLRSAYFSGRTLSSPSRSASAQTEQNISAASSKLPR